VLLTEINSCKFNIFLDVIPSCDPFGYVLAVSQLSKDGLSFEAVFHAVRRFFNFSKLLSIKLSRIHLDVYLNFDSYSFIDHRRYFSGDGHVLPLLWSNVSLFLKDGIDA
jgi:hypothetical protein